MLPFVKWNCSGTMNGLLWSLLAPCLLSVLAYGAISHRCRSILALCMLSVFGDGVMSVR